jgi:hypothetical protein
LEEFIVRRLFIFVLLTSAEGALAETGVVDRVSATDRQHHPDPSAWAAAVAGLVHRLPGAALA